MKLGIGRWVQILETGLLPGKLIQQLNGQTQRLLGQQSLAAYTGLQVDIDRIRADNETRTDAPRKAGLIINTGRECTTVITNIGRTIRLTLLEISNSLYQRYIFLDLAVDVSLFPPPFAANLTKEVKEKMQEEARSKYGLTAEQIREVEEQLEELAANAQTAAGATVEDAALMGEF